MNDSTAGLEREVKVPQPVRWILGICVLAASVLFGLLAWALFRADASAFANPAGGQALIGFSLLLAIGFAFIALRLFVIRTDAQPLLTAKASVVVGIGSIIVGVFLLVIAALSQLPAIASPALFPIAMGIYLYSAGKKRQAVGRA